MEMVKEFLVPLGCVIGLFVGFTVIVFAGGAVGARFLNSSQLLVIAVIFLIVGLACGVGSIFAGQGERWKRNAPAQKEERR